MTWVTTATVLQKLRDSDRDAWVSFADRFRRPVVSFARKLGLRDADAQDVAQETLLAFVDAFRRGDYDPAKGRLSRFLFGIAYRQSLQARRLRAGLAAKGLNAGNAESGFWSEFPEEQQATGIWDTEWEQSLLERCLEQVRLEFEPQTYRAFEMVVRQQQRAPDVSTALGLSINSVYTAKYKILKRIRELRADYDNDNLS